MKLTLTAIVLIGAAFLVGGCPPENYENMAPATLTDINKIRNDDDLTARQKRTQLEALGLSPLIVNALLQSERLANQYGGDLRTAYTKVIEPDYQSLTPDEIQIYGDGASSVDTTLTIALTDEEAQAVYDFFEDEDISSPQDLGAFLDDTTNTVPSTIPSGVLRSLFVNFDSSLLLPELP